MPTPKRTPFQRELDLAKIATWYAQGKPQAIIAGLIGVSVSTIAYDLATVKDRWRKEQIAHIDDRIMATSAKLDMAEREAWAAWELSKEEKVTTTTEKTEGDKSTTKAQLRKEKRNGDIVYFNAAMDVIKERNKLFGLYAAEKFEADIRTTSIHANIDATIDLSGMTDDEINAAIIQAQETIAALSTVGKPLTIDGAFAPLTPDV